MYNGRPIYQDTAGKGSWLRMMPNGQWAVSATENKEANDNASYCYSVGPCGPTPAHCKRWTWKVSNNGRWENQSCVSVRGYNLSEWEAEKVNTALDTAIKEQNDKMVDKLIAAGADVNSAFARLVKAVYRGE